MERGEELPLIGRAEELAFLTEAITERGGAVVGGAAGVGKTRLAREVSAALAGWHVAWTTASRAVSDLPLGGVGGLDLADRETSFHGRAGLLSRLTEILVERSGGRPILVVIDDANLLDGLSAALVHHLSASGVAAVLLTMRAGEQPPSDVVSLYKDGPLPRLELEPLGQQNFATLASAALGGDVEPGTLHQLWCDTAGNVLFLRELVADAVEAGTLVRLDGVWRWTPDGRVGPRLAELVADRMGRLEGDRRLLAELLAVGEPVGADLVQALVRGLDLADEERRGTIVAQESGRRAEVRLAHPLFGEVLRARIPVLQRRRLQRLLADALEAVGSRRRGDVLRLAAWRVESASRLTDEAMTRRPSGLAVFDGDAARARAWVTAAVGERSRAIGQLVTAADDQESRGQPAYAMFALHDALRLGAKHVADRLETLAASLDGPWPAAGVVHARAAVASDAASLEAAADAFAALGAGLVAAEAASEASRRWAVSGHAARAAAAHAEAARLSPGEAGHMLTFIPSFPETPGLAALTRREQEVAALACHGLSNADIAGKLIVSIRTVESHLYSAYGKLGVSDRAALAAVLGSQ